MSDVVSRLILRCHNKARASSLTIRVIELIFVSVYTVHCCRYTDRSIRPAVYFALSACRRNWKMESNEQGRSQKFVSGGIKVFWGL